MRHARLALAALLLASLAACGETPTLEPEPGLVGALAADPDYATLVELATATGLAETLRGAGPYTVLAPTEIAFAYTGSDLLPVLTDRAQRDILRRLLEHHVVEGRLGPEAFTDGATLTTIAGTTLTVRRVGEIVLVDGATVDLDEARASDNGVAYAIANVIETALTARERVALSPTLRTFADFAGRVGALDRIERLDAVTVLAPINDAFESIAGTRDLLNDPGNADVLRRVIGPHLLAGRVDLAALADGDEVVTLDGLRLPVSNDNGVLRVGGIPVLGGATETADGRLYLLGEVLFAGVTLADRVRIQPRLSLFAGRIRQESPVWSRLGDADEALTVFAPTDGVYTSLNRDIALALDLPENAALASRTRRVLVVEGRHAPDDLPDGTVLQALDGSDLVVRRGANGEVFVGGRRVRPTGTAASNGVLYTTTDLIPPAVDAFDTAILAGHTGYARLARRAGFVGTLRAGGLSVFPLTNRAVNEAPRLQLFSEAQLRALLRYSATEADLPLTLADTSFETLDGQTRTITIVPAGRATATFLDGRAEVVDARTVLDGSGRLFAVDTLLVPPGS